MLNLSEGDRAAAQAVRQLGGNATAADKAMAALLARQIQDGREARQVIDSVRDGAERYAQEMDKLNRLLQAGAIDQETWGRAAEAAQKRALEASTRWQDGAIRGLQDYAAEADNTARQVERLMTSAFGRLEDTLTKFVTRQKVSFEDLVNGIAEDFARMMIRTTITGPLASAAASGLGSLFGGLFHDGGIVGDTGVGRALPTEAFLTAPRLHSGSVPWLAPDEVSAILQRGEIVLSRAQAGAIAASADAAPSAPVYVIQVDARGAEGPDAVAARVEEAVDRALAVQLPGVVRAAAGAGVLLPGDLIQTSPGRAHLVTATVNAVGDGSVGVPVEPRLREGVTVGPLVTSNCRVRMRLASDDTGRNPTRPPRSSDWTLEFREVLG